LQGDPLAEGVALMLVGMGAVFAFLVTLIFATKAMSWTVQRLAAGRQAAADPGPGPTPEEAAAIAVAVHRHRR